MIGKSHSEEFKKAAVAKVLARGARTVEEICRELGISSPTIYEWKRKYSMINSSPPAGQSPLDWPAAARFSAVMDCDRLEEEELGAFLRSKGLHKEYIDQWRACMIEALKGETGRMMSRTEALELRARCKRSEADLDRKNRALAEASALLILKKKADSIWGSEASA
jgi:transposase